METPCRPFGSRIRTHVRTEFRGLSQTIARTGIVAESEALEAQHALPSSSSGHAALDRHITATADAWLSARHRPDHRRRRLRVQAQMQCTTLNGEEQVVDIQVQSLASLGLSHDGLVYTLGFLSVACTRSGGECVTVQDHPGPFKAQHVASLDKERTGWEVTDG